MIGFTQPIAALPIIKDVNNNAKGFTSRLLWFFPKPIYKKLQETVLTEDEWKTAQEFRDFLGMHDFIIK